MSLDLPVYAANRPPFVVTPYAYQPLEHSQVRLLTLYPGEELDEIRIRLRHVKLPPGDSGINASSEIGDLNLPEYEALSYTWRALVGTDEGGGNNGNRQFILSITDNLAEAMRRILHNAGTAKTLWVDALCINQADKAEKSIQVPLMTVGLPRSCLAGSERDDSALAMRLIGFTGSRVEVDRSSYSYTGFDADYLAGFEAEFSMGFSDSAFAASVESLLEREWFKRVWVRQEVFLARQAVSFCGMSEMGWVDFRKGALVLAFEFFGMQKAITLMYLVGTFPIDWLEVRDVLKGLECANPRDSIYGLLALIDTHDAGLPEVDYSLSTAEVYTATATHIFRNADALHMLMACELAPDRMVNLPSWVPDWSTNPVLTLPRTRFPLSSSPVGPEELCACRE
ncbi:HET-domain-containing protein [Apiospora aurea]|uniref:HET-domain-containing protein n=1 Tax=Apiospora aurea TaxID=335848 RepID=A0ABR1Q2M6_9PEZI